MEKNDWLREVAEKAISYAKGRQDEETFGILTKMEWFESLIGESVSEQFNGQTEKQWKLIGIYSDPFNPISLQKAELKLSGKIFNEYVLNESEEGYYVEALVGNRVWCYFDMHGDLIGRESTHDCFTIFKDEAFEVARMLKEKGCDVRIIDISKNGKGEEIDL